MRHAFPPPNVDCETQSVKLKMAGTRRWRTAAAEIAKRREDETHITKEYPVYALHSELNAMCPTIKNTGSIIGVPAHLGAYLIKLDWSSVGSPFLNETR